MYSPSNRRRVELLPLPLPESYRDDVILPDFAFLSLHWLEETSIITVE